MRRYAFAILLWNVVFTPLMAMEIDSVAVVHNFIIDFEKREIALIKDDASYAIPSLRVLDSELIDQAVNRSMESSNVTIKKGPLLVGKIELLPKEKCFFTFSNILSILSLGVASPGTTTASVERVTHYYFLTLAEKAKDNLAWIKLSEIRSNYHQAGTKNIEPKETVDILRIMAAARNGAQIDIEKVAPMLANHFSATKLKPDIKVFVPPHFIDLYYANFATRKTTSSGKGDGDLDALFTIMALPFLFSVAMSSQACTLF